MTTVTIDYAKLKEELDWLRENPDFEERPATLAEFLGPNYLNIEELVRPAIRKELEVIMGHQVSSDRITAYAKAMITGGIGIGKTTVASIVLPYLAHWVLCLKNPQRFFNLLPGSRIAFMQMSTSGPQAKEVVFGDIKARVENSPWFQQKYRFDPKFKNQLRFPKEIWILPGDSKETTFEGYNILGGILDEADSHQVTENKDYAEEGYNTIESRIASRFGAVKRNGKTHSYGFMLVIGQMKKSNGFAAKKYEEFREDPEAYAVRMSIWESMGWQDFTNPDGSRDSFMYSVKNQKIVPDGIKEVMGGETDDFIEVPSKYRGPFENDPAKALRDLAGIPPVSGAPFIPLVTRIEECRNRWLERYNPSIEGADILTPVDLVGRIEEWFEAPDKVKRVAHIDIAYSANGDALGFAMGHVAEMVEREGELKPHIVIDMAMRMKAPTGREVFLSDVRRMIYHLKDDLKFRIVRVSMDGFQSVDTRQQLERRRIEAEEVSVDRKTAPYEELREAIYEGRLDFPKYMVLLKPTDTKPVEILIKELSELVDEGNKIEHPQGGSKDVADAVAGVVYSLMGDRTYHRKIVRIDPAGVPTTPAQTPMRPADPLSAISGLGAIGVRAPMPPSEMGTVWRPPARR